MKTNMLKICSGILAAAACLGLAGRAQAFWTSGGQVGGALEQLGIAAEAGEPGQLEIAAKAGKRRGAQVNTDTVVPAEVSADVQPTILGRLSEELEGLYKKTLPSVAALWIYDIAQTKLTEYGDDAEAATQARNDKRRVAVGSGFVMDPNGLIGTNWHVARLAVRGTGKMIVAEFSDNSMVPCLIVGGTPNDKRDMAVLLALKAEPLTPVKFGDSDKLQVGENVFAMGTPFFSKFNFTWGRVTRFEPGGVPGLGGPFVQIDAVINPGNSGGPLFNEAGEIVGINTAIRGGNAFAGIGLSIPINNFNKFVSELEGSGAIQKALVFKQKVVAPQSVK